MCATDAGLGARGIDATHTYLIGLRLVFEASADPVRAWAMCTYMKDQFDFLGLPAPARRAAQRTLPVPVAAPVVEVVKRLWALTEREFQYTAVDLLARRQKEIEPDQLLRLIAELAQRKSWWDTVDGLAAVASNVFGRNRHMVAHTEQWIASDNFWVARLALLHQNGWRESTDEHRLFDYCLRRGSDQEFFIRKAIGWALRDYAWTKPDAVRQFVRSNASELSALSRREALKNIGLADS